VATRASCKTHLRQAFVAAYPKDSKCCTPRLTKNGDVHIEMAMHPFKCIFSPLVSLFHICSLQIILSSELLSNPSKSQMQPSFKQMSASCYILLALDPRKLLRVHRNSHHIQPVVYKHQVPCNCRCQRRAQEGSHIANFSSLKFFLDWSIHI
jgi:hypothetical protein